MSDPPIRLALVGCQDDAVVWQDAAARLRGGRLDVIADSLDTAIEQHETEFDAVIIGSPLQQEPAVVSRAAEAGKHVLVESPVARSSQEVEDAVAACEQAGVRFSVFDTLRSTPGIQAITDRLSVGMLGDPGLLRVHRWANASARTLVERIFPDVDLAIWLFGSKPSEIYALGRGGDTEAAPDYVQIHFGFPAGGMAILDFTDVLPAGGGYDSLSLIGSSGAAYFDDHHNTHLLYSGGNPTALISDHGHSHRFHELQAFVDAITDAIADETRPIVDGDDCRAAHQLIHAVARSLRSSVVLRQQGGAYEPA